MIIIKNKEELAELVDKNKDLFLKEEDIRIEYQVEKGELRDIYCRNLYLESDNKKFDFNGNDFNGYDFNGHNFNGHDFNGNDFNGNDFNGYDFNGHNFKGNDFNGWKFNGNNFNGNNFNGCDFNGWDFKGNDFNGNNFNGCDFNGKKILYDALFFCYGSITCESWEKRKENALDPICLDGELTIKHKEDEKVIKAIKLLEEKGKLKDGKILLN